MRRFLRIVVASLFVISFPASSALAKGSAAADPNGPFVGETAHTITWWCVDLNVLWHVDVPVIVGRGNVIPPDPSPIPDPCTGTWPVTVPYGSTFMPLGSIWYLNNTYPPAVRAALQEAGYDFHSQSPAEDFMSKLVLIRVEIRNGSTGELVAEFSFDPQRNFRLVRVREFFGQLPPDPIVDPALGIDLSSDEVGLLPMFGFPVIAGPVAPGAYRAWEYWTMSDLHNDGLGFLDDDFLPAGETLVGLVRLIVLPP